MKAVPFYPNLPDDTHCNQAALRMMLKYFLPDCEFSWEELEKMTAKMPGKATWPAQMLINLADMGFDVVMVESFDAEAFVKDGGDYLKREFGAETAEWQIANSDIPQEQRLYKKLLNSRVNYQKRIPLMGDIRDYLKRGYLVKLTLNSRKLNHRQGYVGHSIVVYDINDENVTFHDPGLPAKESRIESLEHLEESWADPNDKAKELIAVKYKR